jgi:hypothetical protein
MNEDFQKARGTARLRHPMLFSFDGSSVVALFMEESSAATGAQRTASTSNKAINVNRGDDEGPRFS